MILEKSQIERYLRHIIIPEISGPGQKKLLNSRIFIYGDNVRNVSALAYYLAASGVGTIVCSLHSTDGFEELVQNILDLNEDVTLRLNNNDGFEANIDDGIPSLRIMLGNYTSVINHLENIKENSSADEFLPTIAAIHNSWNGILHMFLTHDQTDSFLSSIKIETRCLGLVSPNNLTTSSEDVLTSGLLGTLAAIGSIKILLEIGELPKDTLYIDLLSMEFNNVKPDELSECFSELLFKSDSDLNDVCSLELYKDRLSKSKVLIIGTGGLGSPAAYALSQCGIGIIGLMDYDRVEISNLNRQILHSKSRTGMYKVKSAEEFLKRINPDIRVITYAEGFNKENALSLIQGYDIVIDGLDNLPTRYLLNDACYIAKKPFLEAGVIRFDGLNTTVVPDESTCYRCIFPGDLSSKRAMSCAETGVLGPIPGLMGFIEAAEAIKLIIKQGKTLQNRLVYFSGEDFEFTTINLTKDPNCPLCGNNPSIEELGNYDFTCENSEDTE
jgi:molybdopterin/thiamine biosynthesis adenylyltransferase